MDDRVGDEMDVVDGMEWMDAREVSCWGLCLFKEAVSLALCRVAISGN